MNPLLHTGQTPNITLVYSGYFSLYLISLLAVTSLAVVDIFNLVLGDIGYRNLLLWVAAQADEQKTHFRLNQSKVHLHSLHVDGVV